MMVLYQDALLRVDELTDRHNTDQHTLAALRQHIAKVEESEADLVKVQVAGSYSSYPPHSSSSLLLFTPPLEQSRCRCPCSY